MRLKIKNICCIGAGYVGGPTMAVIADKCPNIEYLYSSNVVEQFIDKNSTKLVLDNGQIIYSDLIVGSDGYPSLSAKKAGIQHINYSYNQSSIVGIFKHEIPHENEAVQIFLPSGPLAILPLSGNRSSFVWTNETNEAVRIFNLNDLHFFTNGQFLQLGLTGLQISAPNSIKA